MNEATQSITQHVHATPQIFVCIFKMLYDAISTQAPHVIPDAVHLPQWAVATEQSASSGFKTKAGGCFPTRTLHFEGKQGEHFCFGSIWINFPKCSGGHGYRLQKKKKLVYDHRLSNLPIMNPITQPSMICSVKPQELRRTKQFGSRSKVVQLVQCYIERCSDIQYRMCLRKQSWTPILD